LLEHKGSALRYQLSQKSRGVPSYKIRSVAVYKKAISEYNSDYSLDGDWSKQLSTVLSTFRVSIQASKLKGYIQSIERDTRLQITCFSEIQLECLAKTPYGDRTLCIDATGNLVKISDAQNKTALCLT
jgi:hypothetical protein